MFTENIAYTTTKSHQKYIFSASASSGKSHRPLINNTNTFLSFTASPTTSDGRYISGTHIQSKHSGTS
jgi:hypothetical protein